jgi:fructose/tagatose bisphosphate aldolase
LARAAVIVHDLEHARAAVAAAAALGVAVTLRSAPGAASYLGPPVFRAMIDAARESATGANVLAVMDCGRDAGRALAALRHGIERVRVDLPLATKMRLADIAGCYNAALDDDESVALDLLNCDDPAAACQKWLADAEK